MTFYNFLAKAPGTLVVGGNRHRLVAGQTLRLSEGQGKLVASQTASGHEYVMLISIESTEEPVYKEPKSEVPAEVKAVEPELEPKPETEVDGEDRVELEPKPKAKTKRRENTRAL